ncbi:hypothetical protein MYCTH_2137349 [Thermothelomyces thermophilus ATCC 42464]|uniref:Zinc finger PHD-type domain-containing protein n=1 Tax=Thermothelomyces thermophilus (strain ATCC 42464 / BCRC 31852 / DSM 1799) TaxID=573729 RepID=G2Q722_THET4|nr:uncharacterized protein MYCTH_2137349 [Thermothelomyces thermophilus ATCC 42464]AEO54802.1 hypothetical protein MYCTH_2137349 [Thermothelomyces thermophilus ATCC 42464]
MAATDPRRSSRARTNQSQSQNSSTTSTTSGRSERSSRYFNKGGSPQKSTSTGSLSSEPPEDTITAEDPFGTRRRTRGQVEERERAGSKAEAIDMANGDDDVQEEDEAVRCVCGNEEYQGPPPFDEDSKHGSKHAYGLEPFFSADVTDDTAGLFVQCDICKVWQHGGCVGIMTEESSPEEYFCEQCRQDLHKLWTASNGKPENTKRQKTTSRSASPLSDNADDSDEAGTTGRNGATKSKSRSAAAGRNLRLEKVSEKEEKERQRVESANKRKGKGDRRRGDDSDPSEEVPLATRAATNKSAQASGGSNAAAAAATATATATATDAARSPATTEPPAASNPAPDTPPTITVQTKADKKRSHKKKGRNQYTRDRDGHDDDSPARSQSRDIQKDDHGAQGSGKTGGESGGKTNAKSKGGMSSKITMNDMKRRAAALLDFISRTQLELAGESLSAPGTASVNGTNGNSSTAAEKPAAPSEGAANNPPVLALGEGENSAPEKDFNELGCMEMMDSLTRRLVKWQQQYAQ